MHQIFAETQEEEAEALRMYMELVSSLDYVITYNGRRFDIPFLEKRLQHHGMRDFTMPYNLDLYKVVNGFSDLRSMLPNLRQPTVENFMGLWQNRSDEIDGGISVQLYSQYAREFDEGVTNEKLRELILLHNHDDVLQLYRLLKVIEKTDFHAAMTKCGFMEGSLRITQIGIKSGKFCVTGEQTESPLDYVMMSSDEIPAEISFDARSSSFEITLPVLRKNKIVFADLDRLKENEKVSELPAFAENFLVLVEEGKKNYEAANMLAAQLAKLAAKLCTKC